MSVRLDYGEPVFHKSGLTHGEAWFKAKKELDEIEDLGERAGCILEKSLPDRMNKRDAKIYYNNSIYKYWLECMDDSLIPETLREKVLDILLHRRSIWKKNK